MNINNSQIIVYTENKFFQHIIFQHIFPQLYNMKCWGITQLNTISNNISKFYYKYFINTNTQPQQHLVSPDVDDNLKYIDNILISQKQKIDNNINKIEHEFIMSLEGYCSSLLNEHTP